MSLHIAITHHERPAMLCRLVTDILRQSEVLLGSGWGVDVVLHVYDDHSSQEAFNALTDLASPTCTGGRVNVHRTKHRHGRQEFWRIIDRAVNDLQNGSAEFFLLLQDDFLIEPDFLDKLWLAWSALPAYTLAPNPLIFESPPKPRWTTLSPTFRQYGTVRVWETGWLDCYFFSSRLMWEILGYQINEVPISRFVPGGKVSSGVGEQITHRISVAGKTRKVYAVSKTLIRHGSHPSVMHPGHRSRFKMSN